MSNRFLLNHWIMVLLGKFENIMQQSQSSGEDDLVVSEAIPKSRRKPKINGSQHISHYEWKVPLGTQLVGGSIGNRCC